MSPPLHPQQQTNPSDRERPASRILWSRYCFAWIHFSYRTCTLGFIVTAARI